MSRLYYDKKPAPMAAPIKPGAAPEQPQQVQPQTPQSPAAAYAEKVAKLVPSEVIAAYLAAYGAIQSMKEPLDVYRWTWIAFGCCLLATPIYLFPQAEAGKPKWMHLFASSVAFCVWALAISGKTAFPELEPVVPSVLLILFSLFSGAIPLKV